MRVRLQVGITLFVVWGAFELRWFGGRYVGYGYRIDEALWFRGCIACALSVHRFAGCMH